MLISLVQLFGGFVLLVWGANRLVAGASAAARNFGISPLIIGLTIVGFGTSAPELVVSAVAAFEGKPGLAVGNAIGSNIANIGLILGMTALIFPLRVDSDTLRREYPQLMLLMVVCFVMAADLRFTRVEGVLLLAGLVMLMMWMVYLGKQKPPGDPLSADYAAEIPADMPTKTAATWLALGLVVLPVSSYFLVEGAISIARILQVSETVIGLTIVAFGTSLPELATTLTSAFRKEDDLAIGNIIGSNAFNILGVLGLAAVIEPVAFEATILRQDIPAMFLFTVALVLTSYGLRGPGRISRRSGLILLTGFIGYQVLVWSTAVPAAGALP